NRARSRRDAHDLRVGGGCVSDVDPDPGIGGDLARGGDLAARQRPLRLDEPAGRHLSPAVPAKAVDRDEGQTYRLAVGGRDEPPPTELDALDVPEGEVRALLHAGNDQPVRPGATVDEEVSVRTDRGRVDSEVPENRRRGDVELRDGPIHPPGAPCQ